MTEEHKIQNQIRISLSDRCTLFRVNVGKAVFIEVKTPTGKPSEQQKKFLSAVRNAGAIAGICRSVEEAEKLIQGGEN